VGSTLPLTQNNHEGNQMNTDEHKATVVKVLSEHIEDRRLDWMQAISCGYEAALRYDGSTPHLSARQLVRDLAPEEFLWIKNAGVAHRAFDLLRGDLAHLLQSSPSLMDEFFPGVR
jgi:hypothetical protein